ncbi:Ras guanine nucleotide exchange factor domain containing protein [Elaphomyces granulatus]
MSSVSPRRPSNMDPEWSSRMRVLSNKSQVLPGPSPPRRPTLPSRTTSAPAGGLYRLEGWIAAAETANGTNPASIEEIESQSPGLGCEKIRPRNVSHCNGEVVQSKPEPPLFNIAVVGTRGVGKSTFIQCALDLKRLPDSRSSTKRMCFEGAIYAVSLLEVTAQEISFDDDRHIIWPRSVGKKELPVFDGVLVLYDATNPNSILESSRLIGALDRSTLPFLLVACKCDVSQVFCRSDPATIEQAENTLRRYESQGTSSDSPRTQKRCISLILRSIISQTIDIARLHQSGDSCHSTNPTSQSQPQTRLAKDGSEIAKSTSAVGHREAVIPDRNVDGTGSNRAPNDDKASNFTVASNVPTARYGRSNSNPVRPKTPPSGTRLNTRRPSPIVTDISPRRQNPLRTTWRYSAGCDAFSSFLNMEEEADDPESRPTSFRPTKNRQDDHASSDSGATFDELVDRLVSLPMSKQDSKFATVFLCLYRKFAPPARLLNALISHFDKTERSTVAQLTRTADQLRLLNIVGQWVAEYPGDFSYPKTRKRLQDFVSALEKNHIYIYAANEICSHLEVEVKEDEQGWPFSDGDDEEADSNETFLNTSARSSPSLLISRTSSTAADDTFLNMSSLDLSEDAPDMQSAHSGTFSNPSSTGRSGSILTQSSSTLVALEAAQREALAFELTQRHLLTKLQWRQFMDIPEDDFPRELTRIDRIMYSSFKPRDLVRHVTIAGEEKDKIKSLENVNRMIKQFNHLAFFVASMVLLRDKPKHRARALEKFINIAQKLRRQNNYNSLGAVIAGINGTPVQRLTQTRELIPPLVQKEFMRLIILMGTQKGHFAYRLAWENSLGERIPFLPLHRRDLVSAEEGNKTFVGDSKDRINWKKFEVMGDVILGIQRSQRTPHAYIPRNEEVLQLVLDTKPMHNEEDLYARSMQLEPSVPGIDYGRKKFGWLRA